MDEEPEEKRISKQYVHVSALMAECPRMFVLAFLSGRKIVKKPSASMRLVWALGRAAEKHVRNQFIAAVNYEGIVGQWRCPCHHTKHEGFHLEVKCPKCGKGADEYVEAAVMSHKMRVVGSPDLLYTRPDNGKLRVTEIKSMNKKDFDLLVTPVADHAIQGLMYHSLLKDDGHNVDEEGITVFYVCKDYQFKGPYKEFTVRPEEHSRAVGLLRAKAKSIATSVVSSEKVEPSKVVLPQRIGLCSSKDSKTACACPMRDLCFSRE
jgi:hypothetical protein